MRRAVVLLALGLCACAPTTMRPQTDARLSANEALEQKKLVLEQQIKYFFRLKDVSQPLLVAAAPFCSARTHVFGVTFWSIFGVSPAYEEAAFALRFPRELTLREPVPGLPAAAAGLRAGDVLVSVNGRGLPAGFGAVQRLKEEVGQAGARPTTLRVRRGTEMLDFVLTPVEACDYDVTISQDQQINAFADGRQVVVTAGMMRFVDSDAELAMVVGHEIAHNARDHLSAKRSNAMVGAVGGAILDVVFAGLGANTGGAFSKGGADVGASAYSVEYEAEADYVGLYVLARAGVPIEDAPKLWRRMATVNPNAVSHATTHPTTSQRFAQLTAAVSEIKQKEAAGLPLVPNEQPK